MKKHIGQLLFLATLPLIAEDQVELDTLTVGGGGRYEAPADTFETPEYLNSDSYLNKAPGQRRLTTEEALALPGVQGDPVKAVSYMAGVSNGGSGSELMIHASKPRESLTTINHLPIGYLFHMGGLHSVIAPESIRQIDAYLGGFDATYSDTLGGVLDITPKYPVGDGRGFVHMGVFDSSFGYDTGVGERGALFIGGRRSYFDLFMEKSGELTEDVTYSTFPNYYDGTLIYTHQLGLHDSVSFENITARDELRINTQQNAEKDPAATGDVYAKYGFTTTGLRWLHDSGNYKANTLIYRLSSDQETEIFTDYKVNMTMTMDGLYHLSTYDSGAHKINAGFSLMHLLLPLDLVIPDICDDAVECGPLSVRPMRYVDEEVKATSENLFIQDLYRLNANWQVRYGINAVNSNYQDFGSAVDPRGAVVYSFSESTNLAASAGVYTALPNGAYTIPEIGSNALGYEKAHHYTLSLHHDLEEGEWFVIEPYYKKFLDLAVPDSNTTNAYYATAGEGYVQGVDVTYSKRAGNLYLYGAYSFLESKRQISTKDTQLYPFYGEIPHTLQLSGSYRFGGGWTFSGLFKYQSGKLYTPVVDNSNTTVVDGQTIVIPTYGSTLSERMPDYYTLNLKIAREILYPDDTRLEWSFELMNATLHKNVVGIEYEDDYSDYEYVYDLPFLPWFDVTYRF